MLLKKLLKALGKDYKVYGKGQGKINSICDDSRKCHIGDLFVAIQGFHFDAHKFIPSLINKEVIAVVGEITPDEKWLKNITYIKVPDSRKALALLSSAWFNNPSNKLKIIGVTGTDGKTTTANIIYWILKTARFKVGLISSVSAKVGSYEADTGFHVTNPEPLLLHKLLADMVKSDLEYVVLEVTSHGLDQFRVWGIPFETGVLTNITPEHLDYHKTMNDYIKAKSLLFRGVKHAVLNKSDSSFNKIITYISTESEVLSYPSANIDSKVLTAINKRFPEEFNRQNAQAAVMVASVYGVDKKHIVNAIDSFPQVKGRLEEIKNKKGINIYVDFAHTPNALKSVLTEMKKGTSGRLIAVFGCAGERDASKRLIMGEISAKISDFSVFTAEDPRSEDVVKIMDEMEKGAKKVKAKLVDQNIFNGSDQRHIGNLYFKIPDRGEAISFVINKLAKKDDAVVICGKGHEKSMSYNGVEYPWSDQEAVKVSLKGGIKEIKRP